MSRPRRSGATPATGDRRVLTAQDGEGRQHVAAFDFDGTLTTGGSIWRFLVETTGRERVVRAAFVLAGALARAAIVGDGAADEAKEALFRRTLAGAYLEELAPRAAAFGLAHYQRHARADVRARLEWHRARGHRLVIVSASPELYVGPVGRELGVDAVVATRLEAEAGGRLTGRYDGGNCRGERKLVRLREWIEAGASTGRAEAADAGAGGSRATGTRPEPFLWAYGNSAGDLPLLAGADVGVDSGRLGPLGRLRRFRRLSDLDD